MSRPLGEEVVVVMVLVAVVAVVVVAVGSGRGNGGWWWFVVILILRDFSSCDKVRKGVPPASLPLRLQSFGTLISAGRLDAPATPQPPHLFSHLLLLPTNHFPPIHPPTPSVQGNTRNLKSETNSTVAGLLRTVSV